MELVLIYRYTVISSHCADSAPPIYFAVEQIGPTSIRAQWVSTRTGAVRISYKGGSNGTVGVDYDTLSANTVITGLKNGANYTFSIIALYSTFDYYPSCPSKESNGLLLGITCGMNRRS